MKKYEGMFIFPDSLKDDAVAAVLAKAQEEIRKLGGEIESATALGRRTFARPMKKKTAGHYAMVVFRLAPDQVAPLLARYRLDENIFRVQVVEAPAKGAGRITIPSDLGEKGDRDGQS